MAGGFLINSALRGVNDLREIRLLLLVCPLYKEQKMHFLASVYFLIYIYIYIYVQKKRICFQREILQHISQSHVPCCFLSDICVNCDGY